MNKRQEELLTILIAENDYISVEDMASRLKCSERTIRNYIKDINSWLNTFSNIYIYISKSKFRNKTYRWKKRKKYIKSKTKNRNKKSK